MRMCSFCCGRRSCESADATVVAGLGRCSIREYDRWASADSMVAAGQAAEKAIVTITPAAKAITTDERSRCSMTAPTLGGHVLVSLTPHYRIRAPPWAFTQHTHRQHSRALLT